jgi:hypothetical protein
MRPPGRIKIPIYHAHEFYKTIKKRGNDIYSARPCPWASIPFFKDTSPPKLEILVINSLHYIFCPYVVICFHCFLQEYGKNTVMPKPRITIKKFRANLVFINQKLSAELSH